MYRSDRYDYDRDLSYLDMDMEDDLGKLNFDIDGNLREDQYM